MIDDFRESSLKTTSEIAEFLEEKHTLNMARFNNPHFLIAALLFILDLMQCGPASVEAVRKGELGLGYDVDFVFAEVVLFDN